MRVAIIRVMLSFVFRITFSMLSGKSVAFSMHEACKRRIIESPDQTRTWVLSPIWSETEIQCPSFNVCGKWREFWNESQTFSNKFLIENTHEKLAGRDLLRREYKILNRFRSGHGCTGGIFEIIDTVHSMNHILNDCPLRKFDGDIRTFWMKRVQKQSTGCVTWTWMYELKFIEIYWSRIELT